MPITPNMDLDLPSVSVTEGPEWATLLNAAFSLIDSHDHSDGKGVKITQLGLNITGDLDINENYLTDVGSMRLVSQGATLVTPQDLRALYSVSGDLYYNNGSGTPIQITSGGSVTAASDGIARAFERMSVNSNTVISAAGTTSYYDVDTTSGVTFTLPSAAGVAAGRFYEFKDTTGSAAANNIVINRAGADTIDGATSVTIDTNYGGRRLISDGTSKWAVSHVLPNKVQTNDIQNSAITTAKINDLAVTQAKRAALGQQISASSGAFSTASTSLVDVTNLSVTITTTGRPVFVGLISDGNGANASRLRITTTSSTNTGPTAEYAIIRDSTEITRVELSSLQASSASTKAIGCPVGALFVIDVPSAATYTYKVQCSALAGGGNCTLQYAKLIAYEL
jgi:hypothetical protein